MRQQGIDMALVACSSAGEHWFAKRRLAKPELSGKRNGPEVDKRSQKELSGRRQCVQNVFSEGQRFWVGLENETLITHTW
jgi:hypothetical protein